MGEETNLEQPPPPLFFSALFFFILHSLFHFPPMPPTSKETHPRAPMGSIYCHQLE